MSQLPHITSVRLRVHDLDDLRRFYEEVVGLRSRPSSDGAVALRASREAPPVVFLDEDADAARRPRAGAGLFHLAIRLPTRAALSQALRRIEDAGYPLRGASDHLVSEALYVRDPEGNGVEIYRDRPTDEWPTDADGHVQMDTRPLDLDALRVDSDTTPLSVPDGSDLGHVHLEVTDLARMHRFCRDVLGMNLRMRHQGAVFLAWNDYHHHIAANTWRRRSEAARADTLGLTTIRATLSSEDELEALVDRARKREGMQVESLDGAIAIDGPDGIRWEFVT